MSFRLPKPWAATPVREAGGVPNRALVSKAAQVTFRNQKQRTRLEREREERTRTCLSDTGVTNGDEGRDEAHDA